MDTQETGTSTEETLAGDSSTDLTPETVNDDTPEDGSAEDADTLRQRLSDKDRYIKELEAKAKGSSKKVAVAEDQDDVITWATAHSEDLKMVAEEYKQEIDFYKSHKIPVTNDLREKALRNAKISKGLLKSASGESARQKATSSESTGEMRKTAAPDEIPASVKKMAPTLTKEQYLQYKAEFAARGRK